MTGPGEVWGTLGGREVRAVWIEGGGLRARVMTLGAALLELWAPDAAGETADVALGHTALADYVADPAYLGAAVGRTAGRVARAEVVVDGETYGLEANDGPNTLHGGPRGLSTKVWTVEDAAPDRVTLAVTSPAGEGGYPGALTVRLTYTLEAAEGGGALRLDWHAEATAPTPVALAHHGYVNLDGHDAGSVGGHTVQSDADRFVVIGEGTLPTGEVRRVAGTPLDLRRPARLADVFGAEHEQVRVAGGLDHDLLVPPHGGRQQALRRVARVWAARSGRALDVWTTEPGVHVYAGGHLDADTGKGGARYGPHAGLALETQPPPDATHHPAFPDTVLRPGGALRSRTVLRFHTEPSPGG
jgi:aldose 1-epimerase